jgi:trk system potassium uptake protein TrkH
MPFYLSGEIPSIVDALFETVSGYTTTGASILTDVEALSHASLFWRSFTHWLGGMGVLVFVLAIVPLSGGQNMFIMKAESPGPSVGKLVPKIKKTAMYLYVIYFVLTVIEMVALLVTGLSAFDSICTSFATAGTGGFGLYNSSCGGFSTSAQIVITIFMFLFGVNFSFYFLIATKRIKDALKMEEVRWYLGIFIAAVGLITLNITHSISQLGSNLKDAAFQVSSIMTTTGFANYDFDLWPQFSKTILVLLMFVGACAGSTGGGIKVSRIVISLKTVKKELQHLIHPRSVKQIKMDNNPVDRDTVRSVNIFLISYMFILAFSFLIVSLDDFDMVTNFTATVSALNNIGPGLSLVGPTGNFSMFSGLSKVVLMFDMLAGRLEIFPMLVLFGPNTWRKR